MSYIEEIQKQKHDHYGLAVFEFDGCEYAIAGNENEATEACSLSIKDSVWAFNAEFIIWHTSLPNEAVEMIRVYQVTKCEDANDAIFALIEDFNCFVEDAINTDGRGHFLSPYDGDEIQLSDIPKIFRGQVLGALSLKTQNFSEVLLYRLN